MAGLDWPAGPGRERRHNWPGRRLSASRASFSLRPSRRRWGGEQVLPHSLDPLGQYQRARRISPTLDSAKEQSESHRIAHAAVDVLSLKNNCDRRIVPTPQWMSRLCVRRPQPTRECRSSTTPAEEFIVSLHASRRACRLVKQDVDEIVAIEVARAIKDRFFTLIMQRFEVAKLILPDRPTVRALAASFTSSSL